MKPENTGRYISLLLLTAVIIMSVLVVKKITNKPSPLLTIEHDMQTLPPDVRIAMNGLSPPDSLRIPILIYHYVEHVTDTKDTIRQSLNTPPEVFDLQLATLKKNGYTFVTMREVGYILDGELTLPVNPVAITIDDGHWDVYTDIVPILKKYQAKATLYHIAGFTGRSDFLSEDQLRSVITTGLVELGSHTVNHRSLRGMSPEEVRMEVELSKHLLEKTFGVSIDSFAYPLGEFDLQAIEKVKQAGYSTAVSTIPGIESNSQNRFFLPRLRPGNRTGDSLVQWLKQEHFTAF